MVLLGIVPAIGADGFAISRIYFGFIFVAVPIGVPLLLAAAEGAWWLGVGAVILVGMVALSAVEAAAVLYFLGWLLNRVLVAFPEWVT